MDTFAALAVPVRRNIIEILAAEGQLSATDISKRFKVTPPAVSQHLRVLRNAKLVLVEKRAQQRIYDLNPAGFMDLEQWARFTRQGWERRFDALGALLKKEKLLYQKLSR